MNLCALIGLTMSLFACSTGSGKPDAGVSLGGSSAGGQPSSNTMGTGGATNSAGGTIATGGNAATGGVSSVYQPVNAECPAAKASGTTPLIDDMEDGTKAILLNEGRDGGWWWSPRGTTGFTFNAGIEAIPGGRGTSQFATHAVGSGPSDFYGLVAFNLLSGAENDGGPWSLCPYDMSIYTGVRFWARGNGESVRFKATMIENYPVSFGGICAAAIPDSCWNDYGVYLTFDSAWKEYIVPFSSLTQEPGWGRPLAFNPAHVGAIRFQTDPGVNFDYWIDDIAFYKSSDLDAGQ